MQPNVLVTTSPRGFAAAFRGLVLALAIGGLGAHLSAAPREGDPVGACCFSGDCVVLTQAACEGDEGVYVGDGTDCSDSPCEFSACCFDDGTCSELFGYECIAMGGAFHPFDICSAAPCEGACCLEGTCSIDSEFNCNQVGGMFQGNGTTCGPDTCPQACCFGSGCQTLLPDNCASLGGTLIPDTSCLFKPCGDVGACCFGDGSCQDLTFVACDVAGGDHQGSDTSCFDTGCPGACCFSKGCQFVTPFECAEFLLGTYIGPAVPCSPSPCPRACCLPDGSCSDETVPDCAAMNGYIQDPGVTCGFEPCPSTGACCFGDDTCSDLIQDACDAAGGTFHAEESCFDLPCLGACCYGDGSCTITSELYCGTLEGTFLGNDTTCDGDVCPHACCFPDATCSDLFTVDCLGAGGDPQAPGESCAMTSCPLLGACCFSDGTCENASAGLCAKAGGSFQGPGTLCGPGACPAACCFGDGTCSLLIQPLCDKIGGVFQGAGVTCNPSPCAQPGACCLAGGVCQYVVSSACAAIQGTFQGVGLPCSTGRCPAPGVVLSQQKISDTQGGFTGGLGTLDQFGSSVTSLGDLDGDGVDDVAVGAIESPIPADGEPYSGAVWILFLNSDGTVKAQQRIADGVGGLPFGSLNFDDAFGASVAAVGDLNGDGVVDLAVGAPGDDNLIGPGATDRGAVWILFLNTDGTVSDDRKIFAGSEGFTGPIDDFDLFGAAVGAVGDLNGDGTPDLAVGAPRDDDADLGPFLDLGAVWILFLDADGGVTAQQKISAQEGGFGPSLLPGDLFGSSVSAVGDLDGDGVIDVAVGAPGDDDGGDDRGAVWIVFLNPDGTVKAKQVISSTTGGLGGPLHDGDGFGSSVSGVGDLDGDGVPDLGAGAPGDDDQDADGEPDLGAVWVLFLNDGGTVKAHQKISELQGSFGGDLDPGDRFGAAVASLPDINGDGIRDLAVGAPNDDDGGSGMLSQYGALWILFLDGAKDMRFSPPTEYEADGEPYKVAVGDLDAPVASEDGPLPEGMLDVAVIIPDVNPALPGAVQVFLNLGTDGDDWLGLQAQLPTYPVGANPADIALGLFNDDGWLDVAVANRGDGTVSILFNSGLGDGVLTAGPVITGFTEPSALAAADLVPPVGIVDLAVADAGTNTVVILANDGNGNFAPLEGPGIPVGGGPIALEPVDVDGDKDIDLASGNADADSSTIIINEGGGTFNAIPDVPLGDDPSDLTTGDLNNDGMSDLASSNRGAGTATLRLGTGGLAAGGAPTYGPPITLIVGSQPLSIALADLDADHDLDITVVATNLIAGPTVQVLQNLLETGHLAFEPPVPINVLANPQFVATGDLDADGVDDMVTANKDDGPTGGSVTAVLSAPIIECATDYTGDGATGFGDLLILLGNWGRCLGEMECPGDLDGNSVIDFADLLMMLGNWGECQAE